MALDHVDKNEVPYVVVAVDAGIQYSVDIDTVTSGSGQLNPE